jgi:uncharacterized protein YcaQ
MSKPAATQDALLALRRVALQHQGLTKPAPFGTGKQATLNALEHLAYVQIDTLAVVERAHHHTLWSRIPSYKPAHLESLLRGRQIFEYWSHAAAILPIRDYRFALPRMNAVKRGESRWLGSVSAKDEREVLARIASDGPLRARDFKSPKEHQGSWWNWKPAKKTLEKLFFQGELMVASRDGMQKVYDLRERVLPADADTREPSLREFSEYLIDSSLKAHGFTTLKQVTHLRQGADLRRVISALLAERIAAGTLAKFSMAGLPSVFCAPNLLEHKRTNSDSSVRLLSPFDNAVIHRDRLEKVFDFSYSIECYTPQPKRQFGYFCLPILYRSALVGRVDCKADRKNKCLDVLSLHIEKPLANQEEFDTQLALTLERFAAFNGCESYVLHKINGVRVT